MFCVDSWKIIQLCNFNIPMCNATYWLFFILFILFLQFYLFMSHFTHLLGPEQVETCEGPIAFWITIFSPKWSHFSLPEHAPKLTKLGIYITPAKKLFLSYISTTRWRYDQGKCVLVCNFNIVYSTFKNLISTPSLNCVESCHIGGAHFRLPFFFQKDLLCSRKKSVSSPTELSFKSLDLQQVSSKSKWKGRNQNDVQAPRTWHWLIYI